uniref:ABC transporter domain-containing protein n=1 Tax=Trieres chinensis TaxID=1514140 RepID=A0A7S1ZE51_TRICV
MSPRRDASNDGKSPPQSPPSDPPSVEAFSGKRGCHLRWSRITKAVELKENATGLLGGRAIGGNKKAEAPGAVAQKVILNEVSGEARPGEVLALMGPSGSGKTSLLDALSGRSAYETGTYTVDSYPVIGSVKKDLKRKIAYIKQADIFFGHLTVRDQLTYTALLRLPGKLSRSEKMEEVERILVTLRLTKCAETPIMMVSGGERKRVNIGTELLTDPSVVMLDEPTSGLDSTSAVALLRILMDLGRKHGKTVVTSIHQPSSAVFQSFDRLMLLADGCVVYFGTPRDSLSYLTSAGYECPPGYNAADHWMDLLVVDSALENDTMHSANLIEEGDDAKEGAKEEEEAPAGVSGSKTEDEDEDGAAAADKHKALEKGISIRDRFDRRKSMERRRSSLILETKNQRARASTGPGSKAALIRLWDNDASAESIDKSQAEAEANMINEDTNAGDEVTGDDEPKYNTSWLTQYIVLMHRAMKNSRSAIFTPLNFVKSVCLGLMTGLLWFQMEYTERTVMDRASFFFFTMMYWVFDAMFNSVMTFPQERAIIYKERASGTYHLSSFFMAKTTSEAPTRLILPVVYMVISYWMAGANPSFGAFVGTTGCCLLCVLAGESMGLLVGTTIMDWEKSMVVMVIFSLTLVLGGGYYVDNIPAFLVWIPYISPFKYAYDASQLIVFDRPVPCDGSGVMEVVCAKSETGYVTLEELRTFLGVHGTVGYNVGLLLVVFALPRYLAFLALKRRRGAERIGE